MVNTSIVVCGEKFDVGTRVVLWNEPGGFNAYDESAHKEQDRKTGKIITISGKRYGVRSLLNPNPSYTQLQKMITQMFFHHTGNRTGDSTFDTLHKERKLSVHFIIDDSPKDGWTGSTIYQTLDIKEKSWHGGENNSISIGMEICSRASATQFPNDYDLYHQQQYHVLPRKKRYDKVQGQMIWGYEYNDAQYASIVRVVSTICKIFPYLSNADFPRTSSGRVIESIISNPLKHVGLINHYNTSSSKWDPVCLDHQRLLNGIRAGVDQGTTFMTFETVERRQKALALLKYYIGGIDGDWGPKSKQALIDFQKDNGLKLVNWDAMVDYMMDVVLKSKGLRI